MALLAVLALSRDCVRLRTTLVALLWSDRAEAQGRASLRRELSSLSTLLASAGLPGLVRIDGDRIALDRPRVVIDLLDTDAPPRGQTLLEGLDLPGADGFEEWLAAERAALAEARPVPAPRAAGPPRPQVRLLALDHDPRDALAHALAGLVGDALELAITRSLVLALVSDDQGLVRFRLGGTVRHIEGRLRVILRLLDPVGREIWADQFEGEAGAALALAERIGRLADPTLQSLIDGEERRRALGPTSTAPDAYDLFWRANALYRDWRRESMQEAGRLAEQALALEPRNAWAAVLAAFCRAIAVASGWSQADPADRVEAHRLLDTALVNGGDDPFVLGYGAVALVALKGDPVAAARMIDRALALQPGNPSTLFWGGWVDLAAGEAARASDRFHAALATADRLQARPYALTGVGVSLLFQGRLTEALPPLREAVAQIPDYPITRAALAVALGMAGDRESAAEQARALDRLGVTEAILGILSNQRHRELLAAGLRLAAG
jgi:tetratricopeptide (TPR) repeat protein